MTPADDVAAWDALDAAVKEELARRSCEELGLDFLGIERYEQAQQHHELATAQLDGAQWVLVPGGQGQLGYRPGAFVATPEQLASYAEAQHEYGLPELDELLAESLSEHRAVTVPPLWFEATAEPLGREPLETSGHVSGAAGRLGGATVTTRDGDRYFEHPVAPVDAQPAAGDVWRLPTADEWEWACRAGTSTLFRWGDDCPTDSYPVDPTRFAQHRSRNAFGLLIANDPYSSELTSELVVTVGGDGGQMVCGGAGYFVGWLPLASAWRSSLEDASAPVVGLHRRRCMPAFG